MASRDSRSASFEDASFRWLSLSDTMGETLSAAQFTGAYASDSMRAMLKRAAGAEHLPQLTLVEGDATDDKQVPHRHQHTSFWQRLCHTFEHDAGTAGLIAEDLARGVANEAVHHPLNLVKNAAIGLGTGALISLMPELAIPAAAFGGFQLLRNREKIATIAGELVTDVSVINDRDHSTREDQLAAHKSLQRVGGIAADVSAGIVGGIAGSFAADAVITPDPPVPPGSVHIEYEDGQLVEMEDPDALAGFHLDPEEPHALQNFRGQWSYDGDVEEAKDALENAGFAHWQFGTHGGVAEYRLPASTDTSVHFTIEGQRLDPASGELSAFGEVHGYEFDPGQHMLAHLLRDCLKIYRSDEPI
jgi:hypothetical protein